MPKKKTNKAAAKRFKVGARGKITFGRSGKGHLLLCKSRKRKRHLRKGGTLCKSEQERVRVLLSS